MSPLNVVAIILAGGQGTRLYPLTRLRSKPAVPIAGKFRLIDIPISNCLHSNFRQIFICTQFSAESLHRHIFLTYRFDNFTKDFITILSAQQTLENRDWYQGTADAVRQNLRFIRHYGEQVLILSGDHLYRMNYRKLVEFHVQKGADITISVIPVEASRAGRFGIMKVDAEARIIDFREKPREHTVLKTMATSPSILGQFGIPAKGRTHLASMGVYVFNKPVLFALLENSVFEDFGRDVIPHAIRRNSVYAYFFDDYWEDIGTIKSFFKAHMDLVNPLPRFHFYDEERPIYTHPRFLPGAKLLDSDVQHSILCDGSIINRSHIRHSIVGIRSVIRENSVLERVVMMGADYFETPEQTAENVAKGRPSIGVGKHCLIRNAIIDKNARIGNNVQIVNKRRLDSEDRENYVIREGIIVIPKNAVIPDGTMI